ncbi:hypothetical protein OE88DRAFT_1736776 [Heliocybe sulcata]|uniref:Secreted protein n=1 Tax=Heliocybe sulcata TaxID=5364 RepID=A0A5C3MXS9_9AGAM|nr:hypothetical protein OE88DRAFT_1736776 [Heliocybe sulcata]
MTTLTVMVAITPVLTATTALIEHQAIFEQARNIVRSTKSWLIVGGCGTVTVRGTGQCRRVEGGESRRAGN